MIFECGDNVLKNIVVVLENGRARQRNTFQIFINRKWSSRNNNNNSLFRVNKFFKKIRVN